MSRRGRKSKWSTHVLPYLDRIPKWRRQGMTEEQICKKLDVAVSTFNVYKNDYPELTEALKKGKEELIENLEDSLYRKAMGFEYEESKVYQSKDDNGKTVQRVEKYKKQALPDTGALAFALKNLDPSNWRDKTETELSGELDIGAKSEEYLKYLKDDGDDG